MNLSMLYLSIQRLPQDVQPIFASFAEMSEKIAYISTKWMFRHSKTKDCLFQIIHICSRQSFEKRQIQIVGILRFWVKNVILADHYAVLKYSRRNRKPEVSDGLVLAAITYNKYRYLKSLIKQWVSRLHYRNIIYFPPFHMIVKGLDTLSSGELLLLPYGQRCFQLLLLDVDPIRCHLWWSMLFLDTFSSSFWSLDRY